MKHLWPPDPKRILLIKPSAIGDVVHALPIWNLLRSRWPEARITWVVTPVCRGLIEGLEDLEIIEFDRKKLAAAWRSFSAAATLWKLHRQLRGGEFDCVIDLQGLFRSGWMSWRSGAPVRVGLANAREGAWMFYNRRVALATPEQHALDRYLQVVKALGCEGPVRFPFPLGPQHRQWAAQRTEGLGKYAVMLPGANWPSKRWPTENFAQLVEPLWQRWGLRSVVAGGPDDAARAEKIGGAINLAGKSSLMELTALLERAAVVIANDTGPMHIAAALGVPLVALFGPTNPVRTGPYGRMDAVVRVDASCSPCYRRDSQGCGCLRWLNIKSVLQKIHMQLAAASAREAG